MKSYRTPHAFAAAAVVLTAAVLAGCAPKDLAAERHGAYQAYQAGAYAEAAERFDRLVGEIPRDAELWFRLGNAHAKAMNPKKAIEAYENALLRDPEMAKAWYNMGLIYMHAALKTFIDMEAYRGDDDPIGREGRLMREHLLEILDSPPSADGHDG